VRYRLTGAGLSPAGSRQLRLTHRNWKFESIPLQGRVHCEPDLLDEGAENMRFLEFFASTLLKSQNRMRGHRKR